MIPVRVPEPQQQAPRGLESQRVDELLPQQAHRRRAQDDDALLMQADDALIRAKIEQFSEIEMVLHRVRRCVFSIHGGRHHFLDLQLMDAVRDSRQPATPAPISGKWTQ